MTKPLGDARTHYWKTLAMADAVGVSLVAAWDDGRLLPEDHAAMITRCRGCSAPKACAALLGTGRALAEAPAYCANRDVLAQLADGR